MRKTHQNALKTVLFTGFVLLSINAVLGQWTTFPDENGQKFGFKNDSGVVVIPPKFNGYSNNFRLTNICIVTEEHDGKQHRYYLTTSGNIVGHDSVYDFDCEREGFIRFKNPSTDLIGLFDRNGKVVIPAIYNELTSVRNGLLIARKNAKKRITHSHSGHNHFVWEEGQILLIDTNNRVILKSFTDTLPLNFYSHQIHKRVVTEDSGQRVFFRGKNSKYHSFINYKEEFMVWLKDSLLSENFNPKDLKNQSLPTLTFWKYDKGWVTEPSGKTIEKYFNPIRKMLLPIQQEKQEYQLLLTGLSTFSSASDDFRKYYDDCGNTLIEKYPVLRLSAPHTKGTDLYYDHVSFLRTDEGYKLQSFSIKDSDQ